MRNFGTTITLLAVLTLAGCEAGSEIVTASPTAPVLADGRTAAVVKVTVKLNGRAAVGDVVMTTNLGAFAPITDPTKTPTQTTKTGRLTAAGEFQGELYAIDEGTAIVTITVTPKPPNGAAGTPVARDVTVNFRAPADPTITISGPMTPVASDGRTPATVTVAVTRDGLPARGDVVMKTDLGGWSAIVDPTKTPTDTTKAGALAQGEWKAQLYSAKEGKATIEIALTETLPSGAKALKPVVRQATVTFMKPQDPMVTISGPMSPVAADGKAPANLAVTVMRDGQPARGEVVLKTNLGAFSVINDPTKPITDTTRTGQLVQGEWKAQLYSTQSGMAQVALTFTETYATGARAEPIERTAMVTFGAGSGGGKIALLEFVSARPEYLQTKGSGNAESSTITFQAYDAQGAVAEANLEVEFSVTALGGASVAPMRAKTAPGGKVQTTLSAGTVVGSVRVTASTPDRLVTKDSPPITIAGAFANYRNFSFGCEQWAIGGFHLYGLTMKCTANVADRNSQKLGNIAVTLRTEAGAVDQRIVTSATGAAVATYKTQDPQPADVAPATREQYDSFVPAFLRGIGDNGAEPSRMGACLVKGALECNPRDGLTTIIAITAGEEEWTDTNQNGKWDTGEAFVDLPEPFVDVNDNGAFDTTDPVEKDQYNDTNQNGKWDPANGVWDGNTQIWKSAKLVWTGPPSLMSFHASPGGPQISEPVSLDHCGFGKNVFVLVADNNLNMPATRAGNTLSCQCNAGACKVLQPNVNVFTSSYGRTYVPFELSDSHPCSPDCKPACGPVNGALICTGAYKPSDDAPNTLALPNGFTLNVTSQ